MQPSHLVGGLVPLSVLCHVLDEEFGGAAWHSLAALGFLEICHGQ